MKCKNCAHDVIFINGIWRHEGMLETNLCSGEVYYGDFGSGRCKCIFPEPEVKE